MLKYSQITDCLKFYYGDAMEREEVRKFVNVYCHLRDVQYAAYTNYARRFNLTTNELFVLDIIYFAPQGCTQAEICTRMSATKQTISAIIKKFLQLGYVTLRGSGRPAAKNNSPYGGRAKIRAAGNSARG